MLSREEMEIAISQLMTECAVAAMSHDSREQKQAIHIITTNILAHDAALRARVVKFEKALKRIAIPALGGKEQQWIAQQALDGSTASPDNSSTPH